LATVLTIAGSDSSGGAGIQADIKTITAHGCFPTSAITAITAQNTQGVRGVQNIDTDIIASQIAAVFDDIAPHAIKIGMLSTQNIIECVSQQLEKNQVYNMVLDPVMISTSGSKLMSDDAIDSLKSLLIPKATLITPNLAEAEVLSGIPIADKNDMLKAAQIISNDYDGGILIKGGHLSACADDLLFHKGQITWFEGEQIDNPNTHGTGCTLSSAIAANLAKGYGLVSAVEEGKRFVTHAIKRGLNLGNGSGPLKLT